jgi:hypothetical protein
MVDPENRKFCGWHVIYYMGKQAGIRLSSVGVAVFLARKKAGYGDGKGRCISEYP